MSLTACDRLLFASWACGEFAPKRGAAWSLIRCGILLEVREHVRVIAGEVDVDKGEVDHVLDGTPAPY
jgi:hypothetical protein